MTFHTNSATETIELGKAIGKQLQPGAVIALEGTLAAGNPLVSLKQLPVRLLHLFPSIKENYRCTIWMYTGWIPRKTL